MKILLLLLLPLLLFGAKAMVNLEIDRGQRLFVSQKFTAQLKVYTTAFSISDLDVDFGKNSDFIIIAPSSAAYLNSEEIGDETYQYSVYEYELYPLKSGGISLKPFTVSFNTSAGYGQPKEHFELKTSQKELFVAAPKGVDGFILATDKLSIKTSFSSKEKHFKIGDAIVWKIRITAFNLPDVLIPKLTFPQIEGLKLYEDESRLSQTKKEHNFISQRVQSATYVLNRDGNYTLPSLALEWYNIRSKKIERTYSKSYSFEVVGSMKQDTKSEEEKSGKSELVTAFTVVALFLLVLFLLLQWNKRRDKSKYALVKRINPE